MSHDEVLVGLVVSLFLLLLGLWLKGPLRR